ncbi:MAG: chorismate synthase [Thermoleophilia bacterium]|nr:chorismate synthase [Thermoleophilia bacterium]
MRWLTAGESHGPQLTAILEGCPAGLDLSRAAIDLQLARRQRGYGRGPRQLIEQDRVRILGGVRHGRTTGAPIALEIANLDAENWADVMAVDAPGVEPQAPETADPAVEAANDPSGGGPSGSGSAEGGRAEGAAPAAAHDGERSAIVDVPRPGHADLGGALLYDLDDIRDVIERSSARETAARVACGAVARALLESVGCRVGSHVVAIGGVEAEATLGLADLERVDADDVRCLDAAAADRMRAAIDAAAAQGDTLGGVFEVCAFGYPFGVGSYVQGDRRLGARLAAAVMSINAIKGVEIGVGFAAAARRGSEVQDPIVWDEETGYGRGSNHAGGIDGGISTGETVVVRAAMKPIATLRAPLPTVTLGSHVRVESRYERSDTCAVPAASLVGEAMVALTLADGLLERFGGATVGDLAVAVAAFDERLRRR